MIPAIFRNLRGWFIAGAALCLIAGSSAQEMWLRDFNFFGNETVFPDLDPWYERIRDPAKARSSYPHLLFFAGDRHLAGRLAEVNREEVIWQRPDTRELIHFPRQTVRRIVLADGPSDVESPFVPPAPAATATEKGGDVPATVKLAGGDWLFGAISSADGQTFTSQLDDGTSFTVPRPQIEWLYFASLPGPGFGCAGAAMDMEGWIPSYVSASAESGTIRFRGTSWIGRWLEPPKRFEVDLELPEDGEEGTRLWLEEYSARPHPTSFDDINVCFGKKEIARKALIKNRVDRERVPLPPAAQEEKGPVRYQLFYDGPSERLIVVRNGRPVADWSFVRERQGKRRPEREICGLCLDHTAWHDRVPLKLNRLSVRPWDGVIAGRAAAGDHTDRFCAGDGVSIPGKLERISGKELVFSGQPQVRKEGAFVLLSPAADSIAGASAKVILDRNQGEFNVRGLEVHEGKVRCAAGFSTALEFPVSAAKVILFPEPPAAKSPGPEQLLIFKNGDELAGHAISAVSNGPLHWRTTHGQDLEIQPGRIAGVRLSRPPENPPLKKSATMELRDGQAWRGTIMSYDGRQLKFDHELIGPVVVESSLLWRLYPSPRFQALDGGCDPAAWMQEPGYPYRNSNNERDNNPDPWLAFAGSYIRRQAGRQSIFGDNDAAGLQRRIDPALERFEVRFDTISPEGGSTDLHVTIAGGKGMPSLWISASHTELYAGVTAPAGAPQPDSHKLSLAGKVPKTTSRLSFRLFVDLRTGSSDVVINGRRVIHLGDVAEERLTKAEYTLQLRPIPSGSTPNVFSNLWIGPWSGDLPSPGKAGTASTGLANGDVLPGTPRELRDGKWIIESDLGPLELPAEKIVAIDFGGGPQVQPVIVRVRLLDGSTINLDEFAWKDGELSAHSALLGSVHLSIEKIAELVYDPPLTPLPVAVQK